MSNYLKYEEMNKYSLEDLYKVLKYNDLKKIPTVMFGFVMYEKNFEKAEKVIFQCLKDKRPLVREIAVACIGDIARIHGKINIDKVNKIFKRMDKNGVIKGRIDDALDDISIFVK